MELNNKRFALLIDSDNISSKYIKCILDELTKYGIVTYKRIYGDWTNTQAKKWKEELLENSIIPIQQFSNTVGKNATDSALIIDAMDILYTNNVEGFCIVSSDSDFTRLASRLRESGMNVIGMGEKKTPNAFRAACTIFTNLELLQNQEQDLESNDEDNFGGDLEDDKEVSSKKNSNPNVIKKTVIEKDISNIITENENKGKVTELGEIGNRLVNKYPDFDVRNYGYSLLSKFLEEMSNFKLTKKENIITVTLEENTVMGEKINNDIKQAVKEAGKIGIGLNELSNKLHLKYKNFDIKDYGYSTFSKFVQSIKEVEIREDKFKRKHVFYANQFNK